MLRNIVLFDGESTVPESGLWMTNGTAAGTQQIFGSNLGGTGFVTLPLDLTAFGSEVLFNAQGFLPDENSNGFGNSLWVTNLTVGGTYELIGIAGAYTLGSGLNPSDITVFNGKALFQGMDTQVKRGLWVTDGTVAGTHELTGIGGANTTSGILYLGSDLTVYNNEVLFDGTNASGASGLWVTDGTVAGTHELTGISGVSSNGLAPRDLTVFNGMVLFDGIDTNSVFGLWVSDGTSAGTHELNVGGFAGGITPNNMTIFNGEVLFNGTASVNDIGLWVTDGTSAGTHELTGITGVSSSGLNPTDFTLFDGKVLFDGVDTAGLYGLWVTDGTAAGTHELTVSGSSAAGLFGGNGNSIIPPSFKVIDGKVVFAGNDSAGKLYSLFVTDGTSAGSQELSVGGAWSGGLVSIDTSFISLLAQPADFNGGGSSDVLWFNPTSGTVGDWLMSNGTPTWQGIGQASATVSAKGFGDFSGDGTSDILWENPTNGLVGDWLMNNNQPAWQTIGQGSTTMNIAGVGDFYGSGTDDILWQNPTNNFVGEWQMNNNVPTWQLVGQGSTTMNIAGIGDFNGDGKSDILWENPTNNLVGMWGMNGSAPSWSLIGQGSTTMQIVGVGDFTGNGTDDILWENPTNAVVGFWGMNNGQATSWNVVGTASTTYQVAGVGDYNGDGTSDILWRNPTTGDTGIWAMNNGHPSWHDLGASSTAFNVVKP